MNQRLQAQIFLSHCSGVICPFIFQGLFLETLVQSGTGVRLKKPKQISGLGSDIQDKSAVKKRGKKKFITQNIVPHLLDTARKNVDKEMINDYLPVIKSWPNPK